MVKTISKRNKVKEKTKRSDRKTIKSKKELFFDAVSDIQTIDETKTIRFIKSSFELSLKEHFLQNFFDTNLWRIFIGLFFAILFVGYNWNLWSILCFFALMTSYLQRKNRKKYEAIEYCSKQLSKDPERLKLFLDIIRYKLCKPSGALSFIVNSIIISAPKDLNFGKVMDTPCEWVNDIMPKFWPNVNNIVQNIIDKQGFSKTGLDVGNGVKIYFERFTLGDKPPTLSSIRVRQSGHRKDEIVITLKVIYFGNCLILFRYNTKVFLKAKAGVKDIYFRGDVVLTLRPLLEVPPFVGGMSICLQDVPIIDYNGLNLANIADNKLFKNFLINIVSSFLVSPNKLFLCLINNSNIKRELKYPLPIGLCFVEIIEAEDLPAMDTNRLMIFEGSSDSFCKVKVGDILFNTSIIYGSLNPFFGESFNAPIHDFSDFLKIEVFDNDTISSDDFMGSLEFMLSDVGKNKNLNGRDKWIPIGRCPTGALHFRIAVFELSSNKDNINKINSFMKQSSVEFAVGILSVYVYYVSHISTSDEELDFKPMVRLKFSEQTFQTKASKAPKKGYYYFEESTNFLCNHLTKEVLEVSVVCQEMKTMTVAKLFGECNIDIKDIIDSKRMTLNEDFPIRKILKLKDHTEVKNSGFIRLFISLKVCKISKKLNKNLRIATNIQANIERVTQTQNSLSKLYREPMTSVMNPMRTLRIIGNKVSPFASPKKSVVVQDMSEIPINLGAKSWVKIRIKWPDRRALHIEVLKLIQIPAQVVDINYKYAVCVKLSVKQTNTSNIMKTLIKPIKPLKGVFKPSEVKHLQTKYTTKHDIINYMSDIDYNERLIFSISPKNNIDSHVFQIFLVICQPRKYMAVVYDTQIAALTTLIDIPKVDFKGDPIEQWFNLEVNKKFG